MGQTILGTCFVLLCSHLQFLYGFYEWSGMGMELVGRAKALRLSEFIGDDLIKQKELEELIQSLENQESHIEGLIRQEEGLKRVLDSSSNLVPLPSRKSSSENSQRRTPSALAIFEKRSSVDTPCLIEGLDAKERKKLAFELHSRSTKSIFIDLGEVPSLLKSSLNDLENLTLFIPYVENLSSHEQEKISHLLRQEEKPLILGATQKSYAQLKSDGKTDGSDVFLNLLAQAHFKLQRPVKEYLELGFFKLFLESLS